MHRGRSGGLLVVKGKDQHTHNWKRAKKVEFGCLYSLHICKDHQRPLVVAYDMRIVDPNLTRGRREFELANPFFSYEDRV